MKRRPLGRSGVEITQLGFGGAPLGGLYTRVDDDTANAALEAAWDAGVRYFDTAPLYGYGLSELRFGNFLRTKPRDEFVVSTKVGRTLRPATRAARDDGSLAAFVGALPYEATFDFSARGIAHSLEQSCERLGLDRVDVVYIHDPENHMDDAIHTAYPVLHALRERGAVRALGIGTNHIAIAEEFVRRCELDVCMAAGRYTLLDRGAAATLLPLCAQRQVAFVAAGVFNSGILSGPRPADDATFDYAPATPDTLKRVRRIASLCERYSVELPAAALRFALDPAVTACALVGMRSPYEVRANVQYLRSAVSPALMMALEAEAFADRTDPEF